MNLQTPLNLPLDSARDVLSVARLNREARLLIEAGLGTVWVEGEISNLSRPSSGHLYWTLKDANAQVRCAMFRQHNRLARGALENGRRVILRARPSVYEARGDFQLLVEDVEEAGEGLLRRRFEDLKARLQSEGLFEDSRKRPLPRFPDRIGVITSPSGAAIRDVLTVLKRRYPSGRVVVYPTPVQGDAAAQEIARTIALADQRAECDILILARGGGSLEDLWSFNEEIVARAIAAARLPIIAGIGHQTDFTIADFVADLRAPTPSQAAELATPDQHEWQTRVARTELALVRMIRQRLGTQLQQLAAVSHRLHRCHPGVRLRDASQRLDELDTRLARALPQRLQRYELRLRELESAVAGMNPRARLGALNLRLHLARDALRYGLERRRLGLANRLTLAARTLHSLSPLATLQRGYAIVSDLASGAIVTSPMQLSRSSRIGVRLARGTLRATVDTLEPLGPEQEDVPRDITAGIAGRPPR